MIITRMITNYNKTVKKSRDILYIVIHYTGNTTDKAVNNAKYFQQYRGASAHYFVDKTSIYQIIDDKDVAWAVGKNYGSNNLFGIVTNNNSISIEMCSDNGIIADETFNNTVWLTKELMGKYKISPANVHTHFEVCSKRCPGWSGWGAVGGSQKWLKFKENLQDDITKGVVIKNTQKAYPVANNDYPHYRVHQSKIGWNYVCPNGQGAGCLGYPIEALKIDYPGHDVYVIAHIQGIGTKDLGLINRNTVIGTTGQAKRLEGLWIKADGLKARAFCGDKWLPWQKCDGKSLIGTTGKSTPMYVIQFRKDGE